ncbi:unnamed protein product [Protopolystoma xenopodis]|uniref:Pecanex-like protein n=1 Tax=Protopolystoma xenopodis TaxID=117903 RepID=A0A3S4ZRV2_9PLAT|nr:unnamed protein product [Protopolystoma xenopodis]
MCQTQIFRVCRTYFFLFCIAHFLFSNTRDIRTKRIETTNTALASQIRGVSSEQISANLNAIFYEHLTRSLQRCLAGDIQLGRWCPGSVSAGDIFILASDELHFLVHIIEVGNGFVTFQLRGLEFVGTYCHERETEGLRTEAPTFRCVRQRNALPLLSLNSALHLRWVAWEFVYSPYLLDGYRMTDHSAGTSLQLIDLRKVVVDFFVQTCSV